MISLVPKLSPCGSASRSFFERQFPITYFHISPRNMEKQEDNKLTKSMNNPIFIIDENISLVTHYDEDRDDDHGYDHEDDCDD